MSISVYHWVLWFLSPSNQIMDCNGIHGWWLCCWPSRLLSLNYYSSHPLPFLFVFHFSFCWSSYSCRLSLRHNSLFTLFSLYMISSFLQKLNIQVFFFFVCLFFLKKKLLFFSWKTLSSFTWVDFNSLFSSSYFYCEFRMTCC